jgi:hypothetical protein
MITTIKRSSMGDVDFVPIAAVLRSLDALAVKFHFDVVDGADELGRLSCAYLKTEHGYKFALCRYASYPIGVVDLLVPSEHEDDEDGIDEIISELAISPSEFRRTERSHSPDHAWKAAARRCQ